MRLLIIGTLKGQLSTATKIAVGRGAAVTHAVDIEQGLRVLRTRGTDLIMVDVASDIRDLVEQLAAERIHAPIVACGVDNDARAAAGAIQAGAKEYIPLPPDPELIAAVLAAVADDARDLVFRDEAMASLVKLAAQVAASEASILITGESGTGKEMIARYVHEKSPRANKPFVSVNCAAIPENLLESELFGHEKGAFTGAVARRIGKFEEATGGTRPVPVDIRVIATSNRDLLTAVREGGFREDLLYRLNVVNLKLPPLRARPADILELAEHFARRYAEQNGIPARPIATEAKHELMRARWPGNVRELENTIHRAVLLATGAEIGVEAIRLPDGSRMEAGARGPAEQAAAVAGQMAANFVGRTVADVERDLILETLKHCLGNRTHAAKILGVSIRTLRNKLNEYAGDGVPIPAPNGGGELRGAA